MVGTTPGSGYPLVLKFFSVLLSQIFVFYSCAVFVYGYIGTGTVLKKQTYSAYVPNFIVNLYQQKQCKRRAYNTYS